MPNNVKKESIQLYSPEVQELTGRVPGGIIHYGIGLILLLLITLLSICNFISYDEQIRLPLRVLPNMRIVEVRTTTAGTILQVNINDGDWVKASDTLFVILSGNQQIAITAPEDGRVRLVDYLLPHEPIQPQQLLAEIRPLDGKPFQAYALLDDLPNNLLFEQLDEHIILHISGQPIVFSRLRFRHRTDNHSRQALYQSDKPVEVFHPKDTIWLLPVQSSNLLDQLLQTRMQ